MVTQLQPDVRAYLHGGEVIKRYIRVEEVAHEYGFSVEESQIHSSGISYITITAFQRMKIQTSGFFRDIIFCCLRKLMSVELTAR